LYIQCYVSSGYKIDAAAISKALVIPYLITWHYIPEDSTLKIPKLQKFVTMKLHCNENCEQYVINLSSSTDSILTLSEGLYEKTEEQVSAPPHTCACVCVLKVNVIQQPRYIIYKI
jgi:hypothetical protein